MRPNPACTRLALRAVFQSYFRVVIVIRGASAVRRNRPAGDAHVRPLRSMRQGGCAALPEHRARRGLLSVS